ncbi:sensor histidine kinase [Sphaerimonospora cavernae]|uniref:histidine kinase n=1 Tax=Sphaerimonospora cavernae TaxID=1740611 RepID=A0ABV6UBI5_9ACTN
MTGGRLLPRPRSIRARYTLTVALLSLIALTVIGVSLDFAIRDAAQARVFQATQRIAVDWLASMTPGRTPDRTPPAPDLLHRADLLQVTDSRGRVMAAPTTQAGTPPVSVTPPASAERVQNRTVCDPAHDRCVMVTAIRVPPQLDQQSAEPHYIYAGKTEPLIIATNRLEMLTGAGVLLVAAFSAWVTWWGVGRTLRPVAAIRARTSQITPGDLSLRVPEPPRDDEIAQLARTANRTFAEIEETVGHQRQFAQIVSHELRSPVAGLRVRLEEALMYPDDVDPLDTIRTALSTTERLRSIIDEVLAYARVKNGVTALEPVDLIALVREEASSRAYGPPARMRADGELKVLGNRLQLVGVVNNLLANAQRHAETTVEVAVERRDGQAVVIVSDDGDGIAPEDRERVFEPFVRLADGRRRDPGGSGLGLAICRAIVRAHHGTLRVEDSPRGARFAVRLPLLHSDRPAAEPAGVARPVIPVR